MADAMSIKGAFQNMIPVDVELLQGTVISTSPLQIQAANDEKLIIGPSNLFIPRCLTDYTTEVTVDWRTENRAGGAGDPAFASHNHDITGRKSIKVHNALKVGEKVHMVSFAHGKQYYALERVS